MPPINLGGRGQGRSYLLEKGYAVDEPEKDASGKVISDITIPPEKRRRIFINLDETELPLDGSKVEAWRWR